ncbi:uncharacterized protein [Branchiostoma lanceolatum]|uniref:uncharacterized protein n=1 Tax=Branchiostoma lanceolatum TaxID=7740 RepID=UPI0034520C90
MASVPAGTVEEEKHASSSKPPPRERGPNTGQQLGNITSTDSVQGHHVLPEATSRTAELGMTSVAAENDEEKKHMPPSKPQLREGGPGIGQQMGNITSTDAVQDQHVLPEATSCKPEPGMTSAAEKQMIQIKGQLTGRRPDTDVRQQLGNSTITDAVQDQHVLTGATSQTTEPAITSAAETETHEEEEETDSQYTDYLKEGGSSLARTDLDSAEKHFAGALKTVHVRDPTAQQYQREVEPLCKLGDVYSKRGQQTGDGGDFVKAAALYNAAFARSKDKVTNGNIVTAIREVEKVFLKCILDIHPNVSQNDTEKHKKQLKEMRDQIKLEMETIDQQLDPYVHDEDDPRFKEIQAKRGQAVRHLFENIAQQRKKFISLLVEECMGLMGPPPCKYALIGLGSQATGLVTPYSDLEFAILVEEESEECLVYFRNLTHHLHLNVVNLGETILPALGIKSLNDFYSGDPLDNWYYDSVTPRGFAFDGSMPKASKTPLGRQGTTNESPSELICTPENMVSKLQNDITSYLKEGYHLGTILRNPCLIAGDQDLIDTYMAITAQTLQADGCKMAQQLTHETLKEDLMSNGHEETITARLIDVKKEIYRFPAVAVDCLALSSCIVPSTIWETIEEMENQKVISPKNAHHLTVLTSISAELRLRTYIANGGQKENMSALASIETVLHGQESSRQTNDEEHANVLKPVFHLPSEQQLFRYYNTAIPLKRGLFEWSEKHFTSFSTFYDNSSRVQGIMYSELCKYRLAISYYDKALEEAEHLDNGKVELLGKLGDAWLMVGNNKKAISYYEQALQLCKSIYANSSSHPEFANSLNSLGAAWCHLGDYRKAISYYEQALQMRRSIYGQMTEHPQIATSLNDLGTAWYNLGDYGKAIRYHEQALQMFRTIYGQSTAHPDIASILNNLGTAWDSLGDYRKAISYHEQALQMLRTIYGHSTAHPLIANSLNNLGSAWSELSDYGKAISYQEQALLVFRGIYGQTTAHPDTASLLNNLGIAWDNLGDYRKAISYYEQALQMKRGIYGQLTTHPDIALSLNNLGAAWSELSDYGKAISYQEQALQMFRTIYGQNTAHPDIASLLNNLGVAWDNLGDYRKAISYHEQALEMRRIIYDQKTTHPDIALSLNNLGLAYGELGDCRQAISYHEQALQMYKIIHGWSTAHSHIARSLNNLGLAWHELGDHRKAISYFEQALKMYSGIYAQSTAHPEITYSLNNLGAAWHKLGDHRKAISYYEQALQMRRSVYGQSTAHTDIANSLNNLGGVWDEMGNYRKALSYHEQALQMYRSIYGQSSTHPYIANSLSNLVSVWDNLGDYRKAISYYEQLLKM